MYLLYLVHCSSFSQRWHLFTAETYKKKMHTEQQPGALSDKRILQNMNFFHLIPTKMIFILQQWEYKCSQMQYKYLNFTFSFSYSFSFSLFWGFVVVIHGFLRKIQTFYEFPFFFHFRSLFSVLFLCVCAVFKLQIFPTHILICTF